MTVQRVEDREIFPDTTAKTTLFNLPSTGIDSNELRQAVLSTTLISLVVGSPGLSSQLRSFDFTQMAEELLGLRAESN